MIYKIIILFLKPFVPNEILCETADRGGRVPGTAVTATTRLVSAGTMPAAEVPLGEGLNWRYAASRSYTVINHSGVCV